MKWRSAIGRPGPTPWLSTELLWLGSVVLSVFLVSHAVRDAWIENRLERAGLPIPGTYLTTVGTLETATWGLDEYRQVLQDVLRRRPNWSEGYLRLGLVHLGMYRQMTKEWLDDSGVDLDDINRMAEPLWLLGTVHEHPEQATAPLGKLDILSTSSRLRAIWYRRRIAFSRPDAAHPSWPSLTPSWPLSITCWREGIRHRLMRLVP